MDVRAHKDPRYGRANAKSDTKDYGRDQAFARRSVTIVDRQYPRDSERKRD